MAKMTKKTKKTKDSPVFAPRWNPKEEQMVNEMLCIRIVNNTTGLEKKADPDRACLHDGCEQCHGTGKKQDGTACVHFISCPCPKCNATF